ncbi:MAG: hypothetical protein AABX59_00335, partial [Nanoarchaeota archaeon]
VIKYGALLNSVFWLVRGFTKTVTQVYGATILAGILSLTLLPMDAVTYDKANAGRRAEYIVFREIFLSVGRIILLLVFFLTTSFLTSFVFTGLAELLYLLF